MIGRKNNKNNYLSGKNTKETTKTLYNPSNFDVIVQYFSLTYII
jgi:hypothetical protein